MRDMSETIASAGWKHTLPHWAVVVLMALLIPFLTRHTEKPGEFYPFSNYPMYSSFEPETYYVYVTDGQDQPVAMGITFGIAASDVKKAFDRKLDAAKKAVGGKVRKANLPLETQAQAGREVLDWLKDNAPNEQKPRIAKLHALRLYRMDLKYDGSTLVKTPRQVGEVTAQ
jgi:hypothetical protein